MLTTPQAAEKAGISHRAICYAIEDGRLPARRIGRDWTIDEADLEGFVAGREAGSRHRARPLAVALGVMVCVASWMPSVWEGLPDERRHADEIRHRCP